MKGNVHIRQVSYCRRAEVRDKIREERPTVLEVSSHFTINESGTFFFGIFGSGSNPI